MFIIKYKHIIFRIRQNSNTLDRSERVGGFVEESYETFKNQIKSTEKLQQSYKIIGKAWKKTHKINRTASNVKNS